MKLDISGDLWQWDTGRFVETDAEEVHFSHRPGGPSYDVASVGGKAAIPDVLLQTCRPLYAWAFEPAEGGGQTKACEYWPVLRRAMPGDYAPTPFHQRTVRDAIQAAGDAKASAGQAESAARKAAESEVKAAEAETLAPGSKATARMDGNTLKLGIPKGERGDCDFATFEVVGGYLVANYTNDDAAIKFALVDGCLEVRMHE